MGIETDVSHNIVVDLQGTLIDDAWELRHGALQLLNEIQRVGDVPVLWTGLSHKGLQQVIFDNPQLREYFTLDNIYSAARQPDPATYIGRLHQQNPDLATLALEKINKGAKLPGVVGSRVIIDDDDKYAKLAKEFNFDYLDPKREYGERPSVWANRIIQALYGQ